MADVYHTLEDAHRLSQSACGLLALALVKRKFSRDAAQRCVRQWREAADLLERSVLRRESEKS